MEGAVKVLLLAAPILLVSAQTFNNYRNLPDSHRVHIDKALKEANSKFVKGHVAFHSLIGTAQTMASSLNVNVQLMITTCEKASPTAYKHRDECNVQRKNTPLIDCLVCKTTDDKELVDCAILLVVKHGLRKNIRGKCIAVHHIGGSHIMSHKGPQEDHEKQIGCLGCI